jgi:hypothetical protein
MIAIETMLNESIRDISILTDSVNLYENNFGVIKNLAYLNQHFNEPVRLSPELYSMLKRAWDASVESNGIYHIFAGELQAFWEQQFLGDNPASTDPQHDELTSARLDSICEALAVQADLVNYGFTWDDDDTTVMISTNPTYQEYLKLDFQNLRTAFGMEYLYNEFVEANYKDGYFVSSEGYLSVLGPNPEYSNGKWFLNVANPGGSPDPAAIIEFDEVTQINSVMVTDLTAYSYTVRSDFSLPSVDIRRHPFYSSLTGYPSNFFRSIAILSESSTIVEMAIDALKLFHQTVQETTQDLETSRNNSNVYVALYNSGNPIESDNLHMVYANDGSYPLILDDGLSKLLIS